MRVRSIAALVGGLTAVLVLGACTASRSGEGADPPGGEPPASAAPTSAAPATAATPTTAAPATTIDPPGTTAESTETTTTAPATTTTARTEPPRSTTTSPPTTTAPPRPPRNPCVWRVRPGDSLSLIADSVHNRRVTVASLQRENRITDPDRINAGDKIDVCVGNHIDDITGKKRTPPPPPPPPSPSGPTSPPSNGSGVAAQQQKINELFNGLGMPALAVDGDSGRLTEQQLCAYRVALNLPISRADIEPGSPEEQALMATTSLAIPSSAPTWAGRWALVDQTCQIMYVGDGEQLVFAFPISTGQPGFETRDQEASRVFRYDPALENGGWHDSTLFPAAEDNPLNGNMYKPLYFDNGQAIHGANTVPPEPASHGCVRVPVDRQDILVNWLGLGDVDGPTYDEGLIGLTVTVQGHY